MHKLTILCVALALVAMGCSSGQQAPAQPAGVATYGPTSQAAPPPPPRYAQPGQPATTRQAPQPAPSYAPAGTFRWHNRISEAQAQARREGKLILVGSTQPGCGLCEKFKNQIVPQAGSRVSSVAVGYMVNAPKGGIMPEAPYIWQQLRANLASAGLMPLVGVFTPDLRYLTGFGGPANNTQLMNALATARRLYPVSARAPQRVLPSGTDRVAGTTARLNEYGEYEWTPLETLYPEPEDALTPEGVVATADPVLPPAPTAGTFSAPQPLPSTPTTVAAVPAPPPLPPAPVTVIRAPARVAANRPPQPAPVAVVAAPATTPKAAARPRPPFHREPEPALEAWGATALRQALQQIRDGELDRAKSTLAEVGARLPGSTLAREAAKGTVAVYSAERMATADPREREKLREQAERNLGQTMWGVLFRS